MLEAVRPATPEDVPRIVELALLLRAELGVMKGGDLWLWRDAWPEPLDATYAGLLARDDAYVVLGTIDGVAIGYGVVVVETLRSGRRLGVVTDLFVEIEARAVGVGECVAGALVGFCEAQGCVGIDASALPGHRAAKNFFERNGFTARSLTMHRRLAPDA
jgi:ribosomal protein S18 acetylase RimI-like enzyme